MSDYHETIQKIVDSRKERQGAAKGDSAADARLDHLLSMLALFLDHHIEQLTSATTKSRVVNFPAQHKAALVSMPKYVKEHQDALEKKLDRIIALLEQLAKAEASESE